MLQLFQSDIHSKVKKRQITHLKLVSVAIAVELKGRIRLLQEFGRHWSILTGEKCFQVFHENLAELANRIDSISINQHDTTKSK